MQHIEPKQPGVIYATDANVSSKTSQGPKRVYRCGACFEEFSRHPYCKLHEQICGPKNERLNICKYCLCLYGNRKLLDNHIMRQHSDKRWLCLQCGSNGKRYCGPAFLYKHVTEWHSIQSLFYCAICSDGISDAKTFSSHGQLVAHAENVHGLYAVSPESIDGSVVGDTEDLEMLEENIEELLPTIDWDDDLQFGWPEGLSKEDCIADPFEVPKQSRYVCICGNGFTGSLALLNHIKEAHESRNALHCVFCSKVYETREALRAHLQRIHVLVRSSVCDICSRDFATADHLNKHVRSKHLVKKPFECPQCGKTFAQQSHLKQHMETDRGHVLHMCVLCDEFFSRRTDLKRHVNQKHP